MPRGGPADPPASDDAVPPTPRRHRDYLGQTIANKYEVIGLLGVGGMGAVYEVKHVVIGRRFAIKFLHPDIAHSRSTIERFKREAEAAGRLENEHVVAVVDVGTTDDGAPYLVMEYLAGESLGAVLARSGPLPVARAIRLVLQVCRGLEAAHSRGMIHRDLKPENLFVVQGADGADLVKILDFGIVKLTADSTSITNSGLTLGTPYYMSPEQARGDSAIDRRTDIYSVGVVLYELLTDQKPHPGSNATAVLFHLLKQEAVRLETLRPGLPAGLADVIHRAFAFDVAHRFEDVAALWAALTPYSEDGARVRASSPAPAAVLSLGDSSGTLSSTELALPGATPTGIHGASSAAADALRDPSAKGKARILVGVVALALVALAGSVIGRGGAGRAPDSAATVASFPVPAALPPSATGVSAGATERALERPVGRSQTDFGATPGGGPLDGSALPTALPPSTSRSAPRSPAAAGSARQLLREHLYEP